MNFDSIIELVTPKQSVSDIETALARFAQRYQIILDHGFVVSLPDNPLGIVRFRATEVIEELALHVPPDRVLIHLNTFHTKQDLDEMLESAQSLGVTRLLVVSGDGGERLPKLAPEALGLEGNVVSAVELLRYIHTTRPGCFQCGVAFNPYEPREHEVVKLERKIRAGAEFIATQPIIAEHENVDALAELETPVFIGVWMSSRLDLLSNCVGYPVRANEIYDPVSNAYKVLKRYPRWATYFCAVKPETQLAAVVDMANEGITEPICPLEAADIEAPNV